MGWKIIVLAGCILSFGCNQEQQHQQQAKPVVVYESASGPVQMMTAESWANAMTSGEGPCYWVGFGPSEVNGPFDRERELEDRCAGGSFARIVPTGGCDHKTFNCLCRSVGGRQVSCKDVCDWEGTRHGEGGCGQPEPGDGNWGVRVACCR